MTPRHRRHLAGWLSLCHRQRRQ